MMLLNNTGFQTPPPPLHHSILNRKVRKELAMRAFLVTGSGASTPLRCGLEILARKHLLFILTTSDG